jgi:hypothetical protein
MTPSFIHSVHHVTADAVNIGCVIYDVITGQQQMRKGVTVRNRFQHIESVVVCFENVFCYEEDRDR